MAYAAKLCNPTPWEVKLDWDKGIKIKIPAFGDADLNMQQMDDFRPGKPGSEEVYKTLNYYGLFLLDTDRPYDNQAIEALERSRDIRRSEFNQRVEHQRGMRAASGVTPGEEALEETLKQMGLTGLREKVEVLNKQIEKFSAVVGPERERVVRPQLDPKRTVFVLDPPREFPSVAAMEFFLESNPPIAIKHRAYQKEAEQASFDEASTESLVRLDSDINGLQKGSLE